MGAEQQGRHVERRMDDEPVFNTFRRRPLRLFYSLREFQMGLLTFGLLVAVAAWVAWRGTQPDPALFAVEDRLLSQQGGTIAVYERPVQPWLEPGTAPAAPRLDPFPAETVSPGWRLAAPPQVFDETNLYSKINGRETFYKAYGFKFLHCLALTSVADGGQGIDIELFDLGGIGNALGAFSGEISNPDTSVELVDGGLWYATRNGGFLARGRFYARLIGSDDAAAIREKIVQLRAALTAALPAESLPWGYDVLTGRLGINPARVRYHRENAFSFAFATDVYAATVGEGDLEIFFTRRANAAAARALADQFADGFAAYGRRIAAPAAALFQNEYVNAIDAVQARGTGVIGVRLAPTAADAQRWLAKLSAALE